MKLRRTKKRELKKKNKKKEEKQKLIKEPIKDADGEILTPNPAPFDCFYIQFDKKGVDGKSMVLQVDTKDKYSPKKTGIYNVRFQNVQSSDERDSTQQWKYD